MTDQEASRKTILVFGPQALTLNQDAFHKLRAGILKSSALSWVPATIGGLATHFDELRAEFPKLAVLDGADLLRNLKDWLDTGSLGKLGTLPHIPNIVLTPLCVISQLIAYSSFEREQNYRRNDAEAVGFCTGLLAALAVSLSTNEADLELHGGTAVRLAMLIGAVVDAQDALEGESKSFSVIWKTPEDYRTGAAVLHRYPQAYISVRYDENRATVTTSKSSLPEVLKELGAAGIGTMEMALWGRFHSECHQSLLEPLARFCDQNTAFRFPDASELVLPCRTDVTDDGDFVTSGKLASIALKAMLVEPSKWWMTFKSFCSAAKDPATIVTLGPERCSPPSLVRDLPPGFQVQHHAGFPDRPSADNPNDIAIIGMSCKVAGADDVDEFWDLLRKGESQHTEVPESRLSFETAFRDFDKKKKWYGNFVKDHDSFDHRFFKKSPREAASMDPQQRLLLEVAYQAVEQSGYFQKPNPSTEVGCYVGTCAVDYECNVACHAPNAFSSTGNLRGFIAGKVSHYFGWTGPGLTIDTACSGAAVAVHQACKAILSGECETALAGGVNMITQPLAYQNLAAASFLSPTGQCKPFDTNADGYCRGEGVAAVFLKKKSAAIADGDQIFGVVSSTKVDQNQNCTPIFVPNAPSLSDLFRKTLAQAHLDPQQISFVEAHGTGTPVGDPAEYDSIRQVFAATKRAKALQLGSVKGLLGHTESTSGLVSLIKVLLMMHENAIPPQASFQTINPHINTTDSIEISKSLRPWDEKFKAVLINNYGASGSNASMVITQPTRRLASTPRTAGDVKFPFWFSALDEKGLQSYATRLSRFLEAKAHDRKSVSIEDLSFNISRQSNRQLPRAILLSCATIDEIQEKLSGKLSSVERPPARPVVLCFGGQVSTWVGLDRQVFDNATILRSHLNRCDDVCQALGFGSIYPSIFQRTPIDDIVKLQLSLFALQYASAKTWIDCGVQPSALVGHSFGELTALCVSSILNIQDTVRMIAGRAKIIRDEWGSEKGAMMAIEGDLDQVERLLAQSKIATDAAATVACLNGPRSFTLAGSAEAIDAVAHKIAADAAYTSMRVKKLNVSNAFHSTLVQSLMPSLESMAKDLTFNKPTIPVEFASKTGYSKTLTPRYIAEHMRNPVYFSQAVHRLSEKYPSCVWLEAGSNSTVTGMANRALSTGTSSRDSSSFHFQALNITSDNSTSQLTSTTLGLWKAGLNVTFWPHHALQTQQYAPIILPPYQFEKSRHWLELKVPSKAQDQPVVVEEPRGLWIFEGYQDAKQQSARFRVLTDATEYKEMVSSHRIAQTAPICPATLEVDMAIEALRSLDSRFRNPDIQPQILGVENHAPICLDSSRIVRIEFAALDTHSKPCYQWSWKMTSESAQKDGNPTVHVTGQIVFCSTDDVQFQREFARYERLVSHERCLDILHGNDADDDVVQGPNIYRIFDEVVEYGKRYQGLQRLVGRRTRNESAGRVVKKYTGKTWLDAHLSDCFSQVGGIWVNCMTGKQAGEMFIANGFEKWFRSPKLRNDDSRPETWDVLACHDKRDNSAFTTDIFVFDPRSGMLIEAILGINYAKVPKLSMSKLLARLTKDVEIKVTSNAAQDLKINPAPLTNGNISADDHQSQKASGDQDVVAPKVRAILADLSGLDNEEIKDDSDLIELGIDSLVGMELAREIEGAFDCHLATVELVKLTSVNSLVQYIQGVLGLEVGDDSSDNSSESLALSGDEKAKSTAQTSAANSSPASDDESRTIKPTHGTNGVSSSNGPNHVLELPSSVVMDAFTECNARTDRFIEEHGCDGYFETVLPIQNELCVALTLEAFKRLGCDLGAVKPGQTIDRIHHIPSLERLADYLYEMLREAGLIEKDGSQFIRTTVEVPNASSAEILQVLLRESPEHSYPHKLAHFAGSSLADVLTGKSDGIKVVFGTEQGRELASGLYADSPLNKLSYTQMQDFVGRLVSKLPKNGGPLKILELGAGTGGTTKWIVPLLAEMDIAVEYTFSDLAPSFVAAARKRFGKQYPFMKFRTVDIEKNPSDDLLSSQHMVLASNAVHATHSLTQSLRNMRKLLRPDGFVMMLEMTKTLFWVDMIFGLLEGWWLFDDGRRHAIAHESRWEKDLNSAGYGQIEWTNGKHPETAIQRVFLALNDAGADRSPSADVISRQATVDGYVEKYTQGFSAPLITPRHNADSDKFCVLVTGATGSLGSHIVAHLAGLPKVEEIVCLNRRSDTDPRTRQLNALKSRGIDTAEVSKFEVIETDSTKPALGLKQEQYDDLAAKVTHVVHNAWPMSGKRPLKGFEGQFKVMRNLIDFASVCATTQGSRVGFEFVSSIAVVGHYPIHTGTVLVPEERMRTVEEVLPNGYGDAKWVCERMLDETLHQHPRHFAARSVRLGQIAGSKTTGYWNHMEHFSFMVKSSQTLKAFPHFDGVMSWTPVNDVAATLGDLLFQDRCGTHYPIYHIDNPVRQPWEETVPILADAIGADIIPFDEWVQRVRNYPGPVEWENPAAKLADFFDHDYTRMSCGGLLLDTALACEHSETLRAVGPVAPEVVRKYVDAWKEAGFLDA